ncbi:MAG: GAF domain-containing protein, partial [Dehalococcoidales bacterium]
LQSIPEDVTEAMGVKGCSLILLSSDKKTLLHTATYGLSDDYVGKGPLLAQKSISDALLGKVVTILDSKSDSRVQFPELKEGEGIASILSVPMKLRGDIIGVVRVYTSEQHEFTEDEINFVQAVANLGAMELENVRLYAAVKKNYDELRQEMLEWRTSMVGTPRSMWFMRHSRDQHLPGRPGTK